MCWVRDILLPVTKCLVFINSETSVLDSWRFDTDPDPYEVTDLYPDPPFSVAFKMPIKKCWVFMFVTFFTQQSLSNNLLISHETVEIIFFIFWLVDGRIRIGFLYGRPITLWLRIRNTAWNMFQYVFTGISSLKLSYWFWSNHLLFLTCVVVVQNVGWTFRAKSWTYYWF